MTLPTTSEVVSVSEEVLHPHADMSMAACHTYMASCKWLALSYRMLQSCSYFLTRTFGQSSRRWQPRASRLIAGACAEGAVRTAPGTRCVLSIIVILSVLTDRKITWVV